MWVWIGAIAVGVGMAAAQYGRPRGGPTVAVAVLRALGVTLLAALILDAPAGWSASPRPIAALDASASWLRDGDAARYAEAVHQLRALGTDSTFLVGDSLRSADPPAAPGDARSQVRPLVDRALAAGRPVTLVTDGELDDPDALAALPVGSRIVVLPHRPVTDVAVTALDAPRAVVDGDTVAAVVTVAAGSAGAGAGTVTMTLDGRPVATAPLAALDGRAEHTMTIRFVVPQHDGDAVLRAVAVVPGDAEPRNDTLAASLEISPAAGAVFVSTSPDEDSRYALDVLRGAVALPTRGFFRVAPGAWRQDGTLAPVPESEVRRAAGSAPLVVLHGDTAIFGPPRAATHGSLALIPGSGSETTDVSGEWYATDAPASPLAASLAGVPWDSLPPIDVGGASGATAVAGGSPIWVGLVAERARRDDRRIAVEGTATGRHVVVVRASGFWRWRFRGGVAADAYAALWGGIFDWLAAERPDARPAVPADSVLRAGDPVRWRRGSGTGAAGDSVVSVVLVPRGSGAADTVVLRFGSAATTVSAPVAAGVYDVRMAGGSALLVVNASTEWLPNRPVMQSGRVGGGAIVGGAPRLRGVWWIFLVLIGALCAEWIARRRLGLR
jgi:hypothetical protein